MSQQAWRKLGQMLKGGPMKPLLVALALLATSPALAGYDKTAWGMKLPEVQHLYPGGAVSTHPNGDTQYTVLRSVAGINSALVHFTFSGGRGLSSVMIFVPRQGSKVEATASTFEFPTKRDAAEIRAILASALEAKYGAPTLRAGSDLPAWLIREDLIMLHYAVQPDDERVSVGVSYSPSFDQGRPKTEGL